jgi:hypothetical protein
MSVDGVLRSNAMGGGGSSGRALSDGLGRTLLVIAEGSELAVALRDRVHRAYLTVREVRPAEAYGAVLGGPRRPWMVVGDGAELPGEIVDLLTRHPIVLLWRGPQPAGLPAHTRCFERFSDLADAVEAALGAEVGGMRLAPGDGLTMTDAEHATVPALEVLVATHPFPVFARGQHFRRVDAALKSHGVPLRLAIGGGGARLVPENT